MKLNTALRMRSEAGFTLLELIFVLVVAALIAIPVYSRFTESRTRSLISEESENLLAVIGSSQDKWANAEDYAGATQVVMRDNNVIPRAMLTGGAIVNKARGTMTCAPVTIGSTGSNDGLECTVTNYPPAFCAGVAQKLDRAVRRITIGGTLVKPVDGTLDLTALGTQCNAPGLPAVAFVIPK